MGQSTGEYVVGFVYNQDGSEVVLIRKIKPDWQFGKLNGIGGKVEEYDESIYHTMRRECREESSVDIVEENWDYFLRLVGDTWVVHFFRTLHKDLSQFKTMTQEKIEITKVQDTQSINCVPNLRWLIPLALRFDFTTPIVIIDNTENL